MIADDRLIQGMAAGGDFRVVAAQTTTTVEHARHVLDLAPVAADALGRSLTGAVLLARLLAKDVRNQYVTLRFDGNGPLGKIIAEGNAVGHTRGFVENPVPLDEHLDVGRGIGSGMLTVVRGVPPTGQPYTSHLTLQGGGVATELTRYLLDSEQIASAVLLGVMNRREGVVAAGGIVVQALPHARPEAIELIENRIREAPPLSTLLEKMPIEAVVALVFEGTEYRQIDDSFNVPVSYTCSCDRDRALAPLSLLPREELEEMAAEGDAEVTCHFCGRRYTFSREDLLALSAKHEV